MAVFQKTLQLDTNFVPARNSLGNALVQKGRVDEAIAQYPAASAGQSHFAQTHNNLGNALRQEGRLGLSDCR